MAKPVEHSQELVTRIFDEELAKIQKDLPKEIEREGGHNTACSAPHRGGNDRARSSLPDLSEQPAEAALNRSTTLETRLNEHH